MKVGIGILIGGFLISQTLVVAGTVVCGIALGLGLVSLVSRRARIGISAFFAIVGRWIGRALGTVILVPLYLTLFSFARLWQRFRGSDPLQMRHTDRRTFWLETDDSRRKHRYAGTMFATERVERGKRRLLPAAAAVAASILVAELILRGMGFGNPILYVNDPVIGYYPAPDQEVARSGGRVITNEFGMRSPACSREKPDGTYRILMIGDSTLYGGSYIDQEEVYSRLLEKRLAGLNEHGKIEVLSIGVNAWGPFHKLGYIQRKGTFGADLAIVCMPILDIYRPLYGLKEVPFFSVDRPPRCAIEEVLGHLAWRYRATIAGEPSKEAREQQGRRGIEAYVELARLLRRQGCEVMFEILPSQEAGTGGDSRPDQSQAVEQLQRALAAEGFDNLRYPVGLFAGRGAPEELYHDVCHLNHLGHRLYAEYLVDRVGPRVAAHRPGATRTAAVPMKAK